MIKMLSLSLTVSGLLSAGSLSAQAAPSLAGDWRLADGSSTVRIAPCASSNNWCASVIEEKLKPGEPSMLNQMIVRDMRANGKKGWNGRYVVDGQSMKATAKQLGSNALSFKICAMPFLCDTIRLNRVWK